MRSTAQVRGHPLHPVLIAFPVAFGPAAPAFDLAGLLGGWPTAWAVGACLSVATVVVAGVPGFIDYRYTVPPNSSAKKRATWHMGVNLAALALIGLGWGSATLPRSAPGSGRSCWSSPGLGS